MAELPGKLAGYEKVLTSLAVRNGVRLLPSVCGAKRLWL